MPCRYVPPPAARHQARQLFMAAHTSRLFLAGRNILPACCAARSGGSSRFTAPERLTLPASGDDGPASGNAASELAAPQLVPHSRLSVKAVAAGADFAALLMWDGAVLDTRCLPVSAASSSGSELRAQQGGLDWTGLWRPPCGRAVAVAAGGCWQGAAQGWLRQPDARLPAANQKEGHARPWSRPAWLPACRPAVLLLLRCGVPQAPALQATAGLVATCWW